MDLSDTIKLATKIVDPKQVKPELRHMMIRGDEAYMTDALILIKVKMKDCRFERLESSIRDEEEYLFEDTREKLYLLDNTVPFFDNIEVDDIIQGIAFNTSSKYVKIGNLTVLENGKSVEELPNYGESLIDLIYSIMVVEGIVIDVVKFSSKLKVLDKFMNYPVQYECDDMCLKLLFEDGSVATIMQKRGLK